jgi:hypothetical protein
VRSTAGGPAGKDSRLTAEEGNKELQSTTLQGLSYGAIPGRESGVYTLTFPGVARVTVARRADPPRDSRLA